jgi:hypothetical protein
MALLGEINALADDVVPAVVNGGDKSPLQTSPRGGFCDSDAVADGDGIGATNTLQAEVSLHLTVDELAIVRQDGVPASRILYDKALQGIYNLTMYNVLFMYN